MCGEEIENLFGMAENIVFRKADTGFTVLDLSTPDGELVTVVGILPEIAPGEELNLQGHWGNHASFGRQFKAELCERSMPATEAQILKYLSGGTVRGIGPATAIKIVEKFGEDTFDIIENHPEQLSKIRGISMQKAEKIREEFKNQFAMRETIICLEGFSMTPIECIDAYKAFGAVAVDRIKENPYILCTEAVGMGFERADSIARMLPTPPKNELRVLAGIVHVVRHNLSNGHTCIPRDKLFNPSSSLLNTDNDTIDIAIDKLAEQNQLVVKEFNGKEFVFLPYIYMAEKQAAQRIRVMQKFPPAGKPTLNQEILKIEKKNKITYEQKQRLAISTAIEKGMLILTGGPGTGKTTTINGILKLFEQDSLNVVLTAPTGRAAQRMSEITGREAKTIHRLLEAERTTGERMTFARNARNPVDADAIIVDELSMVDIVLFASLLDALPLGCRLIMVGDSDQLPPVGAGNVLHDLIESDILPVVKLDEVFRQAMQSLIVSNAHRIVKGEMPIMNQNDSDFFYMPRADAVSVASTVVNLCKTRLPKAYGYSPTADIQVLCPSKKGQAGTINLNRILQQELNPPDKSKKEIAMLTRIFREGDKVMQIRNDYNICWTKGGEDGTGIFNGDVGVIEKIVPQANSLTIVFDGRRATYAYENLTELELAYAVTVHKSQGSEFEAVIIPAIDIVPQLCYRNLLYTAVTRAKKTLIIVGNQNQVYKMVENDKKIRRYSALNALLLEE
ncbi:MAG: ATP-dependent RecD-like DNA helicase [Oscillospiraceae bacterium]